MNKYFTILARRYQYGLIISRVFSRFLSFVVCKDVIQCFDMNVSVTVRVLVIGILVVAIHMKFQPINYAYKKENSFKQLKCPLPFNILCL